MRVVGDQDLIDSTARVARVGIFSVLGQMMFIVGMMIYRMPPTEFTRHRGAQLRAAHGAVAGKVADANDAVHKIEEWALRMPAPIGDVAKSVARNIGAVVKGEARSDIGREWQSKVLPFCTQALDGRYPLRRGSSIDVTPDDFARLFAPNGLIEGFFKASLQPYVDTSQNPWKPQSSELGSVSLSAAALEQFQRASRIRDMFFAGGATPALHFEVTPRFVDPGAGRAVLNIEGQEIAFDGTSSRPVVVQWPGPAGVHQSSIVFEPNSLPPTALAAAASSSSGAANPSTARSPRSTSSTRKASTQRP